MFEVVLVQSVEKFGVCVCVCVIVNTYARHCTFSLMTVQIKSLHFGSVVCVSLHVYWDKHDVQACQGV